jgi:hypothetical protein
MTKQRLRPTDAQLRQLRGLLDGIPVAQRYDWTSPAGQTFLAHVRTTTERGVPVSWLAQELGLTQNNLHVLLSRYREGAA